MIILAKIIVILFGLFLIGVGCVMLFKPTKARELLRKAGSTNFINYAEITIRMIPAISLIVYADFSKYPEVFAIFGWVMLITSVILYFVPRKLHHGYSLKCAEILTPFYFQLVSPFSMFMGAGFIYSVL